MQVNLQKELANKDIQGVLVEVLDVNGNLAIRLSGDAPAIVQAKQVLSRYGEMIL